jgi:hypothetical protein
MTRVPWPALALGLAGLLPFLYALLLLFSEPGRWPTLGLVPSEPEGGAVVLERFGAVVLGFMGGCLWGFGSAPGRRPTLPVLGAAAAPALIAALALRDEPALSCVWLAFGFVVLQTIDVVLQRAGIAPGYWLSLRLPLTAIVIACLLAGALYG